MSGEPEEPEVEAADLTPEEQVRLLATLMDDGCFDESWPEDRSET